MPAVDPDFDREADERWAATFGAINDPAIRAGVEAAQRQHDERALAKLDDLLRDPVCAIDSCGRPAAWAGFCAHTSEFDAYVCTAHHDFADRATHVWGCRMCKHTGKTAQILRWQPVFAERSRA